MAEQGPTIACKVCGGTSRYLCATPNEHGAIPTIHHYRCDACGLVFVGDDVTNEQLGEAYATLDTKSYYRDVGKTEEKKFATSVLDLKRLEVGPSAALIDIGTGNGAFLLYARERGFRNLSGHDLPGEDTAELTRSGIRVYNDFDYETIPSSSFDAATLLDVMEHVPDPHRVARAMHRILKPGGIVYFHSPSVTVTDRIMHRIQRWPLIGRIGRIWQTGRTSIFHLQNYTPRSIDLILTGANFGAIACRLENELSWPVRRYVKVYLCDKLGLPVALSYVLAPLLYPFLATSLLNSNKAIVSARKPTAPSGRADATRRG
jgi:SAM-dependent methyltransferase